MQKPNDNQFIKKFQSLKLGFELWEILTAFTLALTLASMLLWFSSLQPKQIEDTFIRQDQAKNQLYNISIQLADINSVELRSVDLLPSDSVCSEIELKKDLDKTVYEKQKTRLNSINQDLDNILKEDLLKNNSLNSTPKFSEIAESFRTDINESFGFLEKKLYLSGQILILRETRNSWCNPDSIKINSQIVDLFKEFNSELDNLKTDKSKILLKSTSEIEKIFTSVLENQNILSTEGKIKLVENYKSLWSLQSIQELTEFNKIQNSQSQGRIADYENWQKKYIQDNPKLKSKAIFVVDKK